MAPTDDQKPLSVIPTRPIVLKRPEPKLQAEPSRSRQRPAPLELSEEQRTEVLKYIREPDRKPPSPAPAEKRSPSVKSPDPDLLHWCLGYVKKLKTPRTASEIVNKWYSTWYGHGEDRPKTMTKTDKAAHVDCVSKWLERHEKAGRLRMMGRKGSLKPDGKRKWPAKSYLPVPGADWRRPRRSKSAKKVSEH